MPTITYAVVGMSCDHCVHAVTSELSKLDGVAGVVVDLQAGSVTVTSAEPLPHRRVTDAVEEAGYELVDR